MMRAVGSERLQYSAAKGCVRPGHSTLALIDPTRRNF